MASIGLDNIVKAYGGLEVIHGVSVDIDDGDFVVLVGPSGCGKSTLLRMIAGLEDITAGTLSIGGAVVNNLPPKKRNIAMVFQNYALYPHMTVGQNMGFSLKLGGVPKAEIGRKVEAAAGVLGLGDLLDRFPGQLSGGQRQRVAMGRAIVRDPQVFLFDEPLSNLDAKLRVVMRAEIKSLQASLGTTTVYVTHDQVEAMTMADKIVVMNAGRVEQIGSPLKLFNEPDNMFVASFIGSPVMNFIPGALTTAGAGPAFVAGDLRIPLPRLPDGVPTDTSLILGIRPQYWRREPTGFDAQVEVVEPTGSETQLEVSIGGQRLTVVLHEQLDIRRGDTLPLAADADRMLFFDAASEKRVGSAR